MASDSLEELNARIRSRAEFPLLRMVTVEAEEYRDDVLEVARAELRRRGRNVPSTREFLTSIAPAELQASDLFCIDCHEATTRDAFSITSEMFSRRLLEGYEPCPTCGAVIRDHCFVFFRIPLHCIARYRVKELSVPWPGQTKIVASRKMREA